MPIINYAKAAEEAETKFFQRNDISTANKENIRKYLVQYDVRPATKLKFLTHIALLLKELPDLEKQMHNRDEINLAFQKIRKLPQGYHSTIINVSHAFARWLNNGDKPKGFSDVKHVTKKNQKALRITPADMWNWDDVKKFCSVISASVQMQAIISTQLDGGFRPSEFIDLNYGDVRFHENAAIIHVRDGKTGARDVVAKLCVPALMRWIQAHPTKKPNDALWVNEFADKSHPQGIKKKYSPNRRYDYYALVKRVRAIAERADIKKHCDFYNLRHSSIALLKKQGVRDGLNADIHGTSIEHIQNTYGRSTAEDRALELCEHKKTDNTVNCDNCGAPNERNKNICFKCGQNVTQPSLRDEMQNMKALLSEILAREDGHDLLVDAAERLQRGRAK